MLRRFFVVVLFTILFGGVYAEVNAQYSNLQHYRTFSPMVYRTNLSWSNDSSICEWQVGNIAITSDGSLLALHDISANSIEIFNTFTYSLLVTIDVTSKYVADMSFSSNAQLFGWSESDIGADSYPRNGSVHLFDLNSRSDIGVLKDVANVVHDLYIVPEHKLVMFVGLYPGYDKNDLQVWNYETQTKVLSKEYWATVPAYSSDGLVAFLGTTSSLGITNEFSYQIEVWNISDDQLIRTIELSTPITALTVNSSANMIVSGDTEGIVAFWEMDTGKLIYSIKSDFGSIRSLVFSGDNHLVTITSNEKGRNVMVWDISDRTTNSPYRSLINQSDIEFFVHPNAPIVFIANKIKETTGLTLWNYDTEKIEFIQFKCE